MKMADYLKYCQTKLLALEDLAENFDLAKATAIFQSTDASNIIGSGPENPDSPEALNSASSMGSGSGQENAVQPGATPETVSPTDKCPNQNTQDIPQSIKTTGEINLSLDLTSNNLIQGLIMSEILGSPRAKRWRGNTTIWNSRF